MQQLREREPLECNCGGGMTERLAKLLPYQRCSSCGRVYAPLHRPEGIVMKRVCVDGPVFDAKEVFPG